LTRRSSQSIPTTVLIAMVTCAIVASGLVAFLIVRHGEQQVSLSNIRPSGIPATVSTSLADLMALSPVPNRLAPDFSLVDQRGRTFTLASFKGRVVVLEFMDSHCVDVCPIVSQEFIDAYRDLGVTAAKVVFMAVNVNAAHSAISDVLAFSHEHGLDALPSWHFFTGTPKGLIRVWRAYNVEVAPSGPTGDLVHSSFIYFIDAQGHERYLGSPMADHTSSGTAFLPGALLTSWGTGIALVARSLSPS
jgi:cytochrome oxidase Cu insertion factor (SCO1/SenC/PrrC family)